MGNMKIKYIYLRGVQWENKLTKLYVKLFIKLEKSTYKNNFSFIQLPLDS